MRQVTWQEELKVVDGVQIARQPRNDLEVGRLSWIL